MSRRWRKREKEKEKKRKKKKRGRRSLLNLSVVTSITLSTVSWPRNSNNNNNNTTTTNNNKRFLLPHDVPPPVRMGAIGKPPHIQNKEGIVLPLLQALLPQVR
jgi:hypothetical protein